VPNKQAERCNDRDRRREQGDEALLSGSTEIQYCRHPFARVIFPFVFLAHVPKRVLFEIILLLGSAQKDLPEQAQSGLVSALNSKRFSCPANSL
jgi:hypothetical protein